MRIQEIKLYKFDELSDDAKEKAREWYRDGLEYPWFQELADSLKGFEKSLPIEIKDYSYGLEANRSYINYEITDDNIQDLKGLRLRRWLINNFWNALEKGEFQSTGHKSRYSKMTKKVSCPFTGFCMDENLLDPIRDFINRPNDKETFESLIDECFESFINAISKDIEYYYTDESVDENILANEYEFTENGKTA